MAKEITSNYEMACLKWKEVFKNMDKEELMKELPELKVEGEYLVIFFYI